MFAKPMPLSLGALQQKQAQDDEKQDEAHSRLREDYNSLRLRLTSMEAAQVANNLRFASLENTKPTIESLSFTWRTVVAVVVVAVGGAGSQWAINQSLRSDVLEAIRRNAQVQDERYTAQNKSIDDMRKEFRLLQMNVTDFMLNGRRKQVIQPTDRSER